MYRPMKYLAVLGATAVFCILPQLSQAQNGVITCSSNDMKYHTCNVAPGSQIRMVQQRSGSPCVAGRTYGTRNGQIWVDKGCRADFEVVQNGYRSGRDRDWGRDRGRDRDWDRDRDRNRGRDWDRGRNGYGGSDYRGGQPAAYYGRYDDGKSTCSAGQSGQGRTFCQTDGAFRDAYLQNSNGQCVRGRNWDVDRQYGLWVSGSCSGTWRIQR